MSDISKVQINNTQYGLKIDNQQIEDVISSSPTIAQIRNSIPEVPDITNLSTRIAALETAIGNYTLASLASSINNVDSRVSAIGDINHYFIFKVAKNTPDRPGDDESYPPEGWSSYAPTSVSVDNKLYVSASRVIKGVSVKWNDGFKWLAPISLGGYSSSGGDNPSVIVTTVALYKVGINVTLSDEARRRKEEPSGWSTTPSNYVGENQFIYMITAKMVNGEYQFVNDYIWSAPLRLGNGSTSGTGADGQGYNFVYAQRNSNTAINAPTFTKQAIEESGHITQNGITWYDRPQGVSQEMPYEFVSICVGSDSEGWSEWSTPVVWSKWGERGRDGDSVEYIYKVMPSESTPTISYPYSGYVGSQHYTGVTIDSIIYNNDDFIPDGWTDEPTGVSSGQPCEYVAIRKKREEAWQQFSNASLWAKYGEDGEQGQPGQPGQQGTSPYLLELDNDNIIVDDDISAINLKTISSCSCVLHYGSATIAQGQWTVTAELEESSNIIEVTKEPGTDYAFYIKLKTNQTLKGQEDQVYHILFQAKVNNVVVATRKQTLYVKNINDTGDSYKLVITPNSFAFTRDNDNSFVSQNTQAKVKVLKLSSTGVTYESVSYYTSSSQVNTDQVYLLCPSNVTASASSESGFSCVLSTNVYNVNGYTVELHEKIGSNDILWDSETIDCTTPGANGPGRQGVVFNVNPQTLVFDSSINSFSTALEFTAYTYDDQGNNSYSGLTVQLMGVGLSKQVNSAFKASFSTSELAPLSNDTSVTAKLLNSSSQELASLYIAIIKPQQGIQGAVLRYRGIWEEIVGQGDDTRITIATKFVYNDSDNAGDNIKFIDVVQHNKKYYQCNTTHNVQVGTAVSSQIPGGETTGNVWTEAHQFDFLITETLIADYISSNSVSASDVVIVEKDSLGVDTNIVAGMTSSSSNRVSNLGNVRLWAGTKGMSNLNVMEAPFRVTQEGYFNSSKATIQGNIVAKAFSVMQEGRTVFKITTYGELCNEFPDDSVLLAKDYDSSTPLIFIQDVVTGQRYYIDLTKLTSSGNNYTSAGTFVYPTSPSSLVGTDNQLVNGTNCYTKDGVYYVKSGNDYTPITNTLIAQPINNLGSQYTISLSRNGVEISWQYHAFIVRYLDNYGVESQRNYIFVGPNVYIDGNDNLHQNTQQQRFILYDVIISEPDGMYPGTQNFSSDTFTLLDNSHIQLVPYELQEKVITSVYSTPNRAIWASYNQLKDKGGQMTIDMSTFGPRN